MEFKIFKQPGNVLIGSGATLLGGSILAETMCLGKKNNPFYHALTSIQNIGPLYCRARNGQCCLVAIVESGSALCPLSCPVSEDEWKITHCIIQMWKQKLHFA